MAAVNCGKLWLLAAVLVAIVDLHDDGPGGNGVLCANTRRVETKYDDESPADESSGYGDEESGDDEDEYRAPKRREMSKSSSDKTAESDEESVEVKSRAKRQKVPQQSDRNGDEDDIDDDDDDDDDSMDDVHDDDDKLKNGKTKLKKRMSNKDSDEPKNGKSKLKKGAGNRLHDEDYRNNIDEDDDDENWRRRKKYRKNGDKSLEDDVDENKLESSTTIISGDFDEVLKYINREMISFQPKPLDFTKKSNKKLKSKISKVVNKKYNDNQKDDSGAKITIIQKNRFRKAGSSKKVSNNAQKDKLLVDVMKHVKMLLSILEEKNAS